MKRVTAVFFDAGNTLLHLDYEFIRSLLGEIGYAVQVEDIIRAEYRAKFDIDEILSQKDPVIKRSKVWTTDKSTAKYFTTILTGLRVGSNDQAFILKKMWERHKTMELWVVVQDGTADVLAQIKQKGCTMGVISNSEGRLKSKLKSLGLDQFFSVVIDSGVEGIEKPHPAIFQLALSRAGAKAAEALYVGDIYGVDIIGARGVGMRPVLMDRLGLYAHADCPRISKLEELLPFLECDNLPPPAAGPG